MSAYRPAYDDEVGMAAWLSDETQAPPAPSAAEPPTAQGAPDRAPVGPPPPDPVPAHRPARQDEPVYSEARQRERFGGLNWGAGLFGCLVVAALGVVLTGLVAAAVSALGLTEKVLSTNPQEGPGTEILALAGSLVGIVVVAHYAGGYVAGRMSRFDGGRQGVAVWLISLLLGGSGAGVGLLAGARYDVLAQAAQAVPSLPAGAGPLTAVVATAAVLVTALLLAVVGGKVGCRYHRKVDDAAYL